MNWESPHNSIWDPNGMKKTWDLRFKIFSISPMTEPFFVRRERQTFLFIKLLFLPTFRTRSHLPTLTPSFSYPTRVWTTNPTLFFRIEFESGTALPSLITPRPGINVTKLFYSLVTVVACILSTYYDHDDDDDDHGRLMKGKTQYSWPPSLD
jgi:hypothetical protein